MRTFSIYTLGCKVNQYEGQQIREFLERLGLHAAEPPLKPDLVVVNTCCVTHTASAKSRQYIRRAQKQSPEALIVVCGCLPTVHIGELRIPAQNVQVVRDRSGLAVRLSHLVCDKAAAPVSRNTQSCPNIPIKAKNGFKIKHKNELDDNVTELPPLTSFKGQTRAFLKIQDGCDGYCSYCIVPRTRPFVHSKPTDAVLREAQTLVESGHKEIVITGVFLGAYGQESVRRRNWPDQRNDRLADLLDKVAQIPDLARIRLSSLEPGDVTPRLLEALCANRNIMPHLHLSLQSGSDAVLKKMGRQYGIDEFRQKVELIKSKLDRPAITTDIIVGFPGETDADFERTVALAGDVGFARMHVFTFSPRPGTPAARSSNMVDSKIIRARAHLLHDLGAELGREYRRQFLGETAEILIENDNGRVCGRSERYFRVNIEKSAKKPRKNDLVRARLIDNCESGMIGASEV